MPDPYAASRAAGEQIEALYGRPLVELAASAEPGGMLYALLDSLDALQYADRGVVFHTEQLHRLSAPERAIGSVEATHITDAARRLSLAVTTREAHAQVLGNVLQSLGRVSGDPSASVTCVAVPAASAPLPAHSR
ncbi:hypothetical protein [Streptomyces sp. NPDC058861]|uniref:hypothetical protein n=1 Tax=Streptomyces sp. NPDC058861 TaxID=3346653 RepID=UPI0036C3C514